MRSRLASSLVAILLIVAIGGHWAFLQSVAWVKMVMDFSQEAPLSVAVAKTFDGKHPCNLCKLVQHGKAAEKKQDAIKAKNKIDYWISTNELPMTFSDFFDAETLAVCQAFSDRSETPPVPPPRPA